MRALGTTGLQIHPLCLGGNVFGWTADEAASFAVLDRYVAAGGNFIDTADVYSAWAPGHEGGESERTIGRWLADRGTRDQVFIATKCGAHAGAGLGGLQPGTITAACDASLERLGTDHIDLLYAHYDDESVPLEEMLGAFDALVGAGKVGHVGMSNVTPARLREMAQVTFREGLAPVRVVQPQYNLVDRAGYEAQLREVCTDHDIACVPYYGLAMGFLTGKYRRDSVAADIGSPRAKGAIKVYGSQERAWNALEAVQQIASARELAPAAVALAWLAAQDTVAAPIASARTVAQLEDLLPMATLELTTDELPAPEHPVSRSPRTWRCRCPGHGARARSPRDRCSDGGSRRVAASGRRARAAPRPRGRRARKSDGRSWRRRCGARARPRRGCRTSPWRAAWPRATAPSASAGRESAPAEARGTRS